MWLGPGSKIDGFTYKSALTSASVRHRQKYHVIEITSIKKG
jgi:hypothetical protein